MNLSNMKIGARLAIGFALTIVIMLIMSFSGLTSIYHTSSLTDRIVNDRYVKVTLTNDMRSYSNRGAQSLRNAMLAHDNGSSRSFLDSMTEAERVGAEAANKLEKILMRPEAKKLFAEQRADYAVYAEKRDQATKLHMDGNRDSAIQYLFKEVIPAQTAYFQRLDAILKYQSQLMTEDGQAAAAAAHDATIMMISMLVLATLLSAVGGYLITRSVTVPINEAVDLAETVARGDLSTHISVTRKDETGRLLNALKEMVDSLTRTVGAVRNSSDTITTASAEIAAGNLDLSSRTEQQASSLEETASSMEELTSTVKQNADNARQANQLVVSAAEFAQRGGQVVGEVVSTMGSIKESSSKIVDIIGVIDGIAFQTNILALNAAVEAARAGEQGRGFAVVASEVRNLAQRSASAAKEIKTLIDDSVQKVDAGGRLVDDAGATMQQIVNSVQQVADIMNEITMASQEQSQGIEQVNVAITEMDTTTQQNAALVEQAAAAAGSMQEQAVRLSEAVAVFRLSDSRTIVPVQRAMDRPPIRPAAKPVSLPGRSTRPAAAKPAPSRDAAAAPARAATAAKQAKAPASTANDEWEEF
ncbi:methyl-accepting chemotaxis protein [Massilia sp. NR 4-1]|uniref:methyl-accepting chemotaxis protein n=1 Tax=Massilia sp. NR 4-1 TaxID=1678028 RepID=UPI00067D68C4|nr:methyl-accepting chemotaxis protein [Massilia sp. NR 4-1]AKU23417.1 hypothetical protein ACZ75_20100 [Massilia sp. NR 4-1]